MDVYHTTDTGHPVPEHDGLSIIWGQYRFGFISEASLLQWFTANELRKLSDMGYCVSIYEIAENYIKVGARQLVFVYHAPKVMLSRTSCFEFLQSTRLALTGQAA
jgi:hypothetical protein